MGVTLLPKDTDESSLRVRGGAQAFTTDDTWVRPGDWLSLPAIRRTDNKFVGLLAVSDNDANFLALSAAGNYTVDWGDGTSENVNSGVQANHQYTYSSISSATASSRGYRQVIVTVTPQAGQTFTSLNLHLKHSQTDLAAYETKWLDIAIAGPSLTTITISANPALVRLALLEQAMILSSAVTTWANQFQNCRSLQSVAVASTGTVTSTSFMFSSCSSLEAVPFFNTASVTDMSSMFSGCYKLRAVPWFDTGSATTMTSMFSGCSSLETVPLFNTASVTSMLAMFNSCTSLNSVPLLDTAAVTDARSMFSSCAKLQTIPLLNTGLMYSMSNFFSGCVSLQTVPLLDLTSATITGLMFSGCTALQSIPLLNFAPSTDATNAFQNCSSLTVGACSGTKVSVSYANCLLSTTALQSVFDNLGTANGAQTITISGNWGATVVSLSGTTTAGSATVTMASTAGLATGMEISGVGISSPVAVTFQDTGDTVTRTGHGLSNADVVNFPTIDQTTGITARTPYYVVNKTANTFQVSDTAGGSAKAITVTPAIAFASVTSGSSSTDATSYATTSVTLTAGRLYLLSVENSHGTSATAVQAVTGSDTNLPTFTSRGSTLYNSNLNRTSVWSAVPQTDYTGTITIGFGATTQTGACWSLVEVKGVDTSTNDGIVQAVTATGTSTTPSVNLAALGNANNPTFGAQGHAAATTSAPGGSYVEIHDVTAATPAQALQTLYLSPGSTTVSSTITSAAWGIVGVELKRSADGAGSLIYATTISSIVANTSVTLSIAAAASGAVTTSSSVLQRSKARLKGFTVSG